jgi:hypothetical protein
MPRFGDIPAGCRTHISGVSAKNDDLLSLPLSSKGGEGNGTPASEHRDACSERASGRLVPAGSRAGLDLNVGTTRLYTSGAAASCTLATGFVTRADGPLRAARSHPQARHKPGGWDMQACCPRVFLGCSSGAPLAFLLCAHGGLDRSPVSPPSLCLGLTAMAWPLFKRSRIFPRISSSLLCPVIARHSFPYPISHCELPGVPLHCRACSA